MQLSNNNEHPSYKVKHFDHLNVLLEIFGKNTQIREILNAHVQFLNNL